MPDFHHPPNCRGGSCEPNPADRPTLAVPACDCLFNDSDMYLCDDQDPEPPGNIP